MDTHCINCNKCFSRPQDLQRHLTTSSHIRKRRAQEQSNVVKKVKIQQPPTSPEFGVRLIHRGMTDLFKIYRAQMKRVWNDVSVLATVLAAHIIYLINRAVMDTNGVKVQLRCTAAFYKQNDPTNTRLAWFASSQKICLQSTNAAQEYAMAMAQIHRQIEEFVHNGSGWIMSRIQNVDLYVSKYAPIRGLTYHKLPKELASRKAIVNVKNNDDRCFMWSILAKLHHDSSGESVMNAERVSHYKGMENRLNMDGIPSPVSLEDVPRFEHQNNLAINVFGYGENLYPLYITKDRSKTPINLLLLTPEDAPAHYCWIKSLDRLLYRSTKHKGHKYVCPYCLCPFNTQKRLDKHQEYCTVDKQRVELPEDPILKFKNFNRQIRSPYLIYADFECFLKKDEEGKHLHVPNSYGMIGVRQCCGNAEYEEPKIYRGDDPVKHFLDTIIRRGEEFQKEAVTPINMTTTDQQTFKSSVNCHICHGSLEQQPVRDHCHRCGKFRGAAHNTCNTKLYETKDVSVFFHNLRKYDGHLIMQEIGRVVKERGLKLDCVAKGAEDYISFTIGLQTNGKRWRLRFADSLAFLNASLETLTQSLPPDELTALRKFTKYSDLLSRKGIYPYEFVDSPEKFDLTSLPHPDTFYSNLKMENISDEDYRHAQNVWNSHNLSNFGQYHDLYLLTDVLLLADVFQSFRDFAMKHYGIDPGHYITLPSFAWDALLKYTNVKLELLQDPDMYQFFTAGIRGGVSVISHRYAKARHEGVPGFNPTEPDNESGPIPFEYIMYLDANNLYGWAMQQKLPVSGFEWMAEQERLPEEKDGVGYVWEVDLEYPKEIHDQHNNYPMAPEHMEITHLSPYCKRLKEELNLPDVSSEKLVPNLYDKKNYIVHHQNLKLYLNHGLRLTRIHRGIKFREAAWMAPYIAFNTEMRKLATTQFQKDLFKLLNNAVFGKSMENVFAYLDVRLVTDAKKYEKLVANPLYKESQPFENDLTAVLMNKEKAVLNKPIYTGFAVLDLSKVLMYRFHYEYVWPKYHHMAKLLFTDTDSLCYKVYTDEIYVDMLQDRDEWFDTSDYPANHPLHSTTNKKVIGMMKDETHGNPILEFVGLRAKMYSFITESGSHRRAKGVTKAVVKHCITHDDYRSTLQERSCLQHTLQGFRSKGHEIHTVAFQKTTLSAFDDKRYILDDGISTLAYGHYRIEDASSPSLFAVPAITIT